MKQSKAKQSLKRKTDKGGGVVCVWEFGCVRKEDQTTVDLVLSPDLALPLRVLNFTPLVSNPFLNFHFT